MNDYLSKVIAHRGESHIAPENTLSAIQLAWNNGIKAVEVDIQKSLDNQIVVFHDSRTKRIGNRNKKVAHQLLDELKTIDAGSHKSKAYKGETIPTLIEVLNTIPLDGKLVIEIKSDSSIVPLLVTIIKQHDLRNEQIEFIAFDFKTIAEVKRQFPEHKCLWLLDLDYYWPHWLIYFNIDKTIKKLKKHNLDGLDVWGGKMITPKLINRLKVEGMLLYLWTVNDSVKAARYIKKGVDGITTDKAKWMVEQLTQQDLLS